MKPSLAQTFQDAFKGESSKDRIFPERATLRHITDENGSNIEGEWVMVVLPYDAEYGPTEKTSVFTSGNGFEIDVTRIKDELENQKTCPLQISNTSLYFSPRGEAKCVRGPSGRGASRLARAGVFEQYVEHGKQAQRSPGGRIVCFDRRVVRNTG